MDAHPKGNLLFNFFLSRYFYRGYIAR